MGIGEKMREIRREKGLTQVEVARDLMSSQSYISSVESGKEIPNARFVKLFSLQYGIDYNCLINDDRPERMTMEGKELWLFDLAHGNLSEEAIVKGFIRFYVLEGLTYDKVRDDIHFHTLYGDDNCKRAMEDLDSALEAFIS